MENMWLWIYLGICLLIGIICTSVTCILRYKDRYMLKDIKFYITKLSSLKEK